MPLTTREMGAVFVNPPLAPMIVKLYMPEAIPLDAVTVSVDDPEAFTEEGLKFADACEGRPLSPKVTLPEKLFVAVTVTVKFVELSGTTVAEGGVTAKVNGTKSCTWTCTTELVAVLP